MYVKPHVCCDYPTMNKDSYYYYYYYYYYVLNRTVSSVYRSWFTFDWYQTKTIIPWYDISDLAKIAFLSLIHFISALGSKIVFPSKCQQKEWSRGWTVHYLTTGKVSKLMSRFHGSMTRTESWPLIRANKQHKFYLTAGCFTENSTTQFSW